MTERTIDPELEVLQVVSYLRFPLPHSSSPSSALCNLPPLVFSACKVVLSAHHWIELLARTPNNLDIPNAGVENQK